MIRVVALITAKPGMREKVLTEFHANVPNVLAENGCIEYGPVVDAQNAGAIQTPIGEDTFMVVEKWETMEALAAHAKAPHMAAYAAKVKDMLANRVVHVLSPAG
jgi:quinol monooxygenase YgiN